MKRIAIGFGLILAMLTTGCASTGKYEAWAAAKSAESSAKAEQAKALAMVAANSTDKTLAAFAVFSMSQLSREASTVQGMPEDDWVGIAKAVLPSVIQGGIGLIGKVMDTNLALSKMEIDAAITFNNTAALSKAPTVIYSAPTTAKPAAK